LRLRLDRFIGERGPTGGALLIHRGPPITGVGRVWGRKLRVDSNDALLDAGDVLRRVVELPIRSWYAPIRSPRRDGGCSVERVRIPGDLKAQPGLRSGVIQQAREPAGLLDELLGRKLRKLEVGEKLVGKTHCR